MSQWLSESVNLLGIISWPSQRIWMKLGYRLYILCLINVYWPHQNQCLIKGQMKVKSAYRPFPKITFSTTNGRPRWASTPVALFLVWIYILSQSAFWARFFDFGSRSGSNAFGNFDTAPQMCCQWSHYCVAEWISIKICHQMFERLMKSIELITYDYKRRL